MLTISFKASFAREFNKLEKNLRDEVLSKMNLFKNPLNHEMLKVHKLHGRMKNMWSFSVNYKTRIVFNYESKKEVAFLAIGNHRVYN